MRIVPPRCSATPGHDGGAPVDRERAGGMDRLQDDGPGAIRQRDFLGEWGEEWRAHEEQGREPKVRRGAFAKLFRKDYEVTDRRLPAHRIGCAASRAEWVEGHCAKRNRCLPWRAMNAPFARPSGPPVMGLPPVPNFDYLRVSAADLGRHQPVKVRIGGDQAALALDMAEAMLAEINQAEAAGRGATLIVPVGPVDQFPILARLINERRISCRATVFINMDEYLTAADDFVPVDHPLSFRGYMDRRFYALLDPALAPPAEHRVFPRPGDLEEIPRLIAARGGVDACFGGIGINGHIAFNEPPEPGERISFEEFAALPTRVLTLARETRTINSVTVGGEIAMIPRRAVTVGMKEILAARRLRFYCNRPWQSAVVRRALHGALTPECPASYLRTHADAVLTVADYVATPPEIKLR